ncbi:MAG: hypothetical protein JWQ25_1288 [Daejeonella sp.]|nr:hypothetical protein [Daejeonella sp.]
MENQVPITINHLQHAGIPVSDIAVSEIFYNRLGFENVMQSEFILEGKPGVCMMMKNKDVIIELYQLPDHKLAEIKSRSDGHVDHIAFDVDDVDSTFQTLKNAGYRIVEEEPVFLSFWKQGCKYFNILGPDGEKLEFNEIVK